MKIMARSYSESCWPTGGSGRLDHLEIRLSLQQPVMRNTASRGMEERKLVSRTARNTCLYSTTVGPVKLFDGGLRVLSAQETRLSPPLRGCVGNCTRNRWWVSYKHRKTSEHETSVLMIQKGKTSTRL